MLMTLAKYCSSCRYLCVHFFFSSFHSKIVYSKFYLQYLKLDYIDDDNAAKVDDDVMRTEDSEEK